MKLEDIWEKCLSLIEKKVGTHVFELWFKPVRLIQLKDQNTLLEVPNRFFKEWIEDYYPNIISEVMFEVIGSPVNIRLKITEKEADQIRRIDARLESRRQRLANKGIYLNPKYTFDNFVTGQSNQVAFASAKAVADTPGEIYNPFFIYGGVGLGKTHLLTAIGNYVADKKKDYNIVYVSSEQFTNEFVSAMRHQRAEEMKAKYRSLDLLLLDDVQFFAGKNATQDELFHTINALYERQKQIVLTSDRPPKDIKDITDRLRSRFGMGLTVDIQPPELELKMAIIQKKAAMDRLCLSDDVIEFLASKIRSNIRELEGCLIRLGAHAALTGETITVQLAKDILKDIIVDEVRPITIDQIQKTVAEAFGIKCQDMKSKRRTKEIAIPRQIAMYISKKLLNLSLSDVGKNFGGKDHATVIYSCKQVEERMSIDDDFKRLVEGLIKRIRQ